MKMKDDRRMAVQTITATNESAGELLRSARESIGASRAEAAATTKIPLRYIAALEDGPCELPDNVYTKIYLKTYCAFLELDAASITQRFQAERAAARRTNDRERRHPLTSVPPSRLIVTPKLISTAIVGIALAGLGAYLAAQLLRIAAPPAVAIASPADGWVTSASRVSVSGRADREATVTINGNPVTPNGDGAFSETLELREGLNTITIVAKKKRGKETVVTRRVIVE
jgi:cytoskeletal protein RodZ